MATVKGTTGSDSLNGTAGADVILLDKGNDTANGGAGNDIVDGGNGNDTLNGDANDDTLLGGDGNDSLDGGTGDDYMYGGDGNDTYVVDSILDVADETDATTDGGGIDSVRASVTYTLGDFIENGTITSGTGLTLTGNGLANTLINASAGSNTLDGGAGSDIMSGTGGGNTTFLVGSTGDTVTGANGASDLIVSDVSWSLATQSAGVENLTLSAAAGAGATATGSTGANVITANDLGNTLDGGGANDTLVGGDGNDTLEGGAGNDSMAGGLGDDTYFLDNASDSITEAAAEGTDTVNAGFTTTLSANFENLTLTGTGNFNGTGNASVNIITGNSGNNTLDGVSGNDTLNGGDGNDTLLVHSGAEVVDGGDGTDTILSDVTLSLQGATVSNVENLTLTASAIAGSTAVGTTGSNVLTGNALANTLDGGGAGGTDTLIGGAGNDVYIIYNNGDIVSEDAAAGTDTVILRNNTSYTLSGNLENLTLEGDAQKYGALAMTATGNTGANVITDNSTFNGAFFGEPSVNNILLGGDGNDTLVNNVNGTPSTKYGVSGTETLDGGTGADTMSSTSAYIRTVFVVDNALDTVDGNLAGDEVRSSINWDLGAAGTTDVDNLTLTGTALIGTGNGDANIITGNASNNTLTGLAGNDVLSGGDGQDTLSGGADIDILSGGDGNDSLDGGTGDDTMIGGLGNDAYVVDSSLDVVSELAGQGTDTVISSVDYTLSGNIENLTITGAAVTAIGDAGANVITGNGNANTIDGMGGADAMSGGAGNDLYFVDNAGDQVFENAGEGTDTVNASVSYTLSGTSEVEILNLTGTANINGTGNAAANTITGNSGNNTLDGGAGVDTLIGGTGDDTYVTDNPGDVLSEVAGQGNDTVVAGYSYTAAAEFENVTLSGTGDFNATGNASVNTLVGNSGNNTLDGLAGADSMEGGAGNDYFIVDNVGDVVTDLGGGNDTAFSSVSLTLGAGVENLILDTLVVGAIDGTGNASDNSITGTDGDNVLNGLGGNDTLESGLGNDTLDGGTGADSMTGGDGDDTYYVDNAGDVVTELLGEGDDTLFTSVNYTLTGSNLENVIATGTGNINITGTNDDDVITGNTGNNTLTGLGGNDTLDGGGGNDRLIGGMGDDYYVVDSSTDVVSEAAGEGDDTVESNGTYTLSANIENGVITGAGTLTGGTGDNTLTSEAVGANVTLNGGAGADVMVNAGGGLNNVTFVVDNVGDSVEGSATSTDTVRSSISFDLGGAQSDALIDNLVLTGNGALNGTGNANTNTITGTSGINTLDGGGGADTLIGLAGNDTYVVDDLGDVIIDSNGVDTVTSSTIDVTLATGLEKLLLTGVLDLDGTGNSVANTLTGNDGINTLSGLGGNDTLLGGLGGDFLDGGLGNDRLTGGADADTFLFTSTANGRDTVTDFNVGQGDVIDVSAILGSPGGPIEDYLQVINQGANTIIRVDADGTANGTRWVQIATLTGVNLGTDETALVGSGTIVV
ncbi:MAG TPA: type I secretion C-terminal target domain-containing protein [Patescibacteria group bacterium]|nr:type I secretion C-terminal target domain-containing protein [Patescibacteria group bacterium]